MENIIMAVLIILLSVRFIIIKEKLSQQKAERH